MDKTFKPTAEWMAIKIEKREVRLSLFLGNYIGFDPIIVGRKENERIRTIRPYVFH